MSVRKNAWVAALLAAPLIVVAADDAGLASLPGIADYCDNDAVTAWTRCNVECTSVTVTPFEARIAMECSRKCLERADATRNGCVADTTKTVKARFFQSDPADVKGYCTYIGERQREQARSFRIPSVVADDAYQRNVARCVAALSRQGGEATAGAACRGSPLADPGSSSLTTRR